MNLSITVHHNNQELRVYAFGSISGSRLSWETDYSNVKVLWGKVDLFPVLEDTDLMEKIYQQLDEAMCDMFFSEERRVA